MKKDKAKLRTEAALLHELEMTQRMLEAAHSNFENVLDPELIDCYIYEVNAAQHRYTYLLRQLKESRITTHSDCTV